MVPVVIPVIGSYISVTKSESYCIDLMIIMDSVRKAKEAEIKNKEYNNKIGN